MWSLDLLCPPRSRPLSTTYLPDGSLLSSPPENQRQPRSWGTAFHSGPSDWMSLSSESRDTARQPSSGMRLWVWSIDRRGPLSVVKPTPITTFCSGASRSCAITGAASGVLLSVSSVRNTES